MVYTLYKKVMKRGELIRKLTKAGFKLVKGRKNAGHDLYVHPDGRMTSVSRSTSDIPTGTLKEIRKQTQIDL